MVRGWIGSDEFEAALFSALLWSWTTNPRCRLEDRHAGNQTVRSWKGVGFYSSNPTTKIAYTVIAYAGSQEGGFTNAAATSCSRRTRNSH